MVWDIMRLSLRVLWRRIGVLLLANVIWLALSLLILPWPAATAGLFALMQHLVEEELAADPYHATIQDFWLGMRQHWLRASLLGFGNLLCLLLIVIAMRFYGESQIDILSWLVGPITLIGLAWAGAQLYLFALLIHRITSSPLAVAREAFLMSISYPIMTFSLLITSLMIAIGSLILAGPILLIFFAYMALLQTITLRSVLVRRGEIGAMTLTAEQRVARSVKF